jgi:hypothetical protein
VPTTTARQRRLSRAPTARFGQAKGEVRLESGGLRSAYLSSPQRKVQRLLAPVYIVTIEVTHEQESQAFVMAVPATEKSYLPLDVPGAEGLIAQTSKLASRRCC